MTQFHTIRAIDNSRLVRREAPNRLREMARLAGLGALLALVAFLYAWQHFACIQLRYQLESLKSQRAQAVRSYAWKSQACSLPNASIRLRGHSWGSPLLSRDRSLPWKDRPSL
jgi:hypothetical protein